MANEICIFKKIEAILNSDSNLKNKLNTISEILLVDYGAKTNFCEIYTTRWSFFAGIDDVVVPEKRIRINDNFGIIAEGLDMDDAEIREIVELLGKEI